MGDCNEEDFWLARRLKKGNKDAHGEVQKTDENVENVRAWIYSNRGLAREHWLIQEGNLNKKVSVKSELHVLNDKKK